MGGVRAELELPLEHRGEPPAAVARAVEETALALGRRRTCSSAAPTRSRAASSSASRSPPRWSTGPSLLLLDEPTSQLDPVAGDELVWLLRRLNEDWGTAVVLAEHRLERCLPAADRVIALVEGADRLRRLAARAPRLGRRRDAGRWPPRRRACSRWPACRSAPPSVKEARAGLRAAASALEPPAAAPAPPEPGPLRRLLRRDDRPEPAVALRSVWFEIEDGPSVLRGARPRAAARRAGRADGPQRRRQEHAAAARQGPGASRRGGGSSAPERSRCCSRTRATT